MTTANSELRLAYASDGAALHYEVCGAGEPVVFLHGGLTNRASWSRRRRGLDDHFRLILRDLRGHDGAPAVVPANFGFATSEADDLCAVLAAEGLDAAHIVGHSTGGAIALLFALRHPQKVRRMMLIEPTLPSLIGDFETLSARFPGTVRAVEPEDVVAPQNYLHALMSELAGANWQTRMPAEAVARMQAMAPFAVAHADEFKALAVSEADVRALAVPTLLLYGEQSWVWEAEISAEIGRVRPDLERHIIRGAAHNVHRRDQRFPQHNCWMNQHAGSVAACPHGRRAA